MTTTQGNMQQLMMDAAVNMSVAATARMFGLSEGTVTRILQIGLPMMAKMAEENPELLKALYAQSLTLLPEPVQQFYAKLAENPEALQAMIDEFKTSVGPMMESLNREAAQQAGTTPEQAADVLAATYPAVAEALTRQATTRSEAGFGQRLKDLAA
jgi:hypothetical protein